MKCISIIQPWASLILLGDKQYETRNWSTPYRGPLLIHASKGMPPQCVQLLEVEPFRSILAGHGIKGVSDLPRAVILGKVELVDCIRTELLTDLTEQEKAFGHFAPGRWAWKLANLQPLVVPVRHKGTLGVYDVAADLVGGFAHGH